MDLSDTLAGFVPLRMRLHDPLSVRRCACTSQRPILLVGSWACSQGGAPRPNQLAKPRIRQTAAAAIPRQRDTQGRAKLALVAPPAALQPLLRKARCSTEDVLE